MAAAAAVAVAANARPESSFHRYQTVARFLVRVRSQASMVSKQNPTTSSPSILRHDDAMTLVHARHVPVPALNGRKGRKRALETLNHHWRLPLPRQCQQIPSDPETILHRHNKVICPHGLQPRRLHSNTLWSNHTHTALFEGIEGSRSRTPWPWHVLRTGVGNKDGCCCLMMMMMRMV
ncbi:MAG: hypothetical protein J3Q66DRAFT_344087 [Benniella sp.]|nr:MAG: hypothetical protein J3Q66DRAFT_344087 [Benniella sp.]